MLKGGIVMSIKTKLINLFAKGESFNLDEIYIQLKEEKEHSIRARLNENVDILFERLSRGVYKAKDNAALLINGNGRDLSYLENESIDLIITDHPWSDKKSNRGGNRDFANYETFQYIEDDFKEKARILKNGNFLIEMLPAENDNNFDYLYELKKMAQKAGFEYYAKVAWKKGSFISNTGRNSKNTEDVMIFSKGKARNLRLDAKKNKAEAGDEIYYMSGTNGMLPTEFNHQPPTKVETIQKSQKPVSLFEKILEFTTFEGETVLDQFAGSGSVGIACSNKNRRSINIELNSNSFKNMKNRFKDRNFISMVRKDDLVLAV